MTECKTVEISWKSKVTGVKGHGKRLPVGSDGITETGVLGLKRNLDKVNPTVDHTVTVRKPLKGRGVIKITNNP